MSYLLFGKHFLLSNSKTFSSPQSSSLIFLYFEYHIQHLSLLLWPPITSWWYNAKYHITGIIAICMYLCDFLGIIGSLSARTMSNLPVVSTFPNPLPNSETVPLLILNNVCWIVVLVWVGFESSTKLYVPWSQGSCLNFLLYSNCPSPTTPLLTSI